MENSDKNNSDKNNIEIINEPETKLRNNNDNDESNDDINNEKNNEQNANNTDNTKTEAGVSEKDVEWTQEKLNKTMN